MNPETKFFMGLMELQYGQKVEHKLRKLAPKIPWAKGWPEHKQAFWNAEAFMWSRKIEKETRALITRELKYLTKGKNLDLGCGAYSYIPSVGLDFSPRMLHLNDNCYEKIPGDLEQPLPLPDEHFDSVTAIFVLNYIQSSEQLVLEIGRILKPRGKFVIVMSATKINRWQRQKQVNDYSVQKWKRVVQNKGFKVKVYEKEKLWFLKGLKI